MRFVLEGSVRKAAIRVRITGQLIEAATGIHLWAGDTTLTDIFAVQDEITQSVAAAIERAMAQAERQRVSRKPPDSLDAWKRITAAFGIFLIKSRARTRGKATLQQAITSMQVLPVATTH